MTYMVCAGTQALKRTSPSTPFEELYLCAACVRACACLRHTPVLHVANDMGRDNTHASTPKTEIEDTAQDLHV